MTMGLHLLCCYSQHLRPVSARFLRLRKVRVLEFRFLSSSAPREKLPILKAKRREAEDGALDDGGGGDNGSVVLAAREKIGGGSRGGGEGRIVVSELHKEATEAYMAYAMSVLLSRALPNVRDGLKPVHRRILCVNCTVIYVFFWFRKLLCIFLGLTVDKVVHYAV
ncbi:unnamed protein product [Coffea canephora]|uniref:DH200=94 genomic scaffold, scaffold_299 n=1 Tax=Coffea canephora TaxID=49390 RepID=A0A068VE72_COFCA|nr:unnamed protein product [Coffea canephora]